MWMRFCPTMRRPAFSISALTAPVRLRAVASGLMMEKVRSIAMVHPQIKAPMEVAGLYRCRRCTASDAMTRHGLHGRANGSELRRIHPDEPFLKRLSRPRSVAQV